MAARNAKPVAASVVLSDIRRGLETHLGEHVNVKAQRGRRKVTESDGVLESIYPNIFVVKVNASGGPRRLSYTYSEVLTRAVRIRLRGSREELEVDRLRRSA